MSTRTLVLFGVMIIAGVVGLTWIDGDPAAYTNESVRISARARSAPRPPADPTVPGVRAVGLMINAPTTTGDEPADDGNAWSVDLAFFGTFERTRLALELTYPEGGIIDLRNEESTLAVFEDDKGKNLIKDEQHFGPFEMMPRISEDGRHLVFVLPSDELPFASASRLHAAGEVALLVADESATFTAADVHLTPGTTFEAGDFAFEIKEAGKSSWGDGYSLTLVSEKDLAPIVSYGLRTQDGRVLPLEPSMSMSGGGTWHQTLEVEEPVQRGDFVVECWQDSRTVMVPFEVSTGLGLR